MSLIKLKEYIPVSPNISEEEYYEGVAANLLILKTSVIYNNEFGWKYPWLLHLRETLGYFHLECLKRAAVFRI